MRVRRTGALVCAVILTLVVGAAAWPTATAAPGPSGDRATLMRYAEDTWASFVAMTDERTGLPSDNVAGDLSADSRSAFTSPTNIASYLWSTVTARDLG